MRSAPDTPIGLLAVRACASPDVAAMLEWADEQDQPTLVLLIGELVGNAFSVTPRALDLAVWGAARRRRQQEHDAAEAQVRRVRALQQDGPFREAAFFAAERRLDRAILALKHAESRDPGFHRSTTSATPSAPTRAIPRRDDATAHPGES